MKNNCCCYMLVLTALLSGCATTSHSSRSTSTKNTHTTHANKASKTRTLVKVISKDTEEQAKLSVNDLVSSEPNPATALPANHTKAVVEESLTAPNYSYEYTVKGKNYQVLADATSFQEIGMASWYGNGFHGKKTASGEIFNMNAMTAAHKTLPLGSYVRVKNLSTGKEIVVRINDRGPFHSNRIIDLSKKAAKSLGIIRKGHAKVHIKAIDKPTQ